MFNFGTTEKFDIKAPKSSPLGNFIKFIHKKISEVIDNKPETFYNFRLNVTEGAVRNMNYFHLSCNKESLKSFLECLDILLKLKHSKNKNLKKGFQEFKKHFPENL
ncbi:hypothetical protein ACFL2R_03325 [Patescibacteria group bacterium]